MSGSDMPAPYRLKSMSDLLQLSTPEFLIKDWLLENTIAMMVGDTGSFKSTLAIDIAVCIQNSRPWHSFRTRACNVAIFNHEDGDGFKKRYLASLNHHQISERLGFWDSEVPNLLDTSMVDARISAMKEAQIGFVVFDTLAHGMPGADENSAKEMGVVIANLIKIKQQLNATVLVVHHTGKDAAKGARGSSSLKAAVDTEITVKASRRKVTLSQSKQRHCRTSSPLHLIAQEVPFDGQTACILVPDREAGMVVGKHHLTGKAAVGLSMLTRLAGENGTVPLDLYMRELEGNESFTTGQTKTGSFKRAFSRLLDDLSDYELITVSGDQLVLTDRKI